MVPKDLSIFPRPWGRPTVEWMIRVCRASGPRSKVVADEVGAVIDVQDVGDAAHRPRWVCLSPDRLPQSEGSVDG